MTLTEEEKKLIIAMVVSLVTKAMFELHFYQFAGTTFHQQDGGPIGLRGTCAVARLAMQLFDVKWKELLSGLNLTIWIIKRYMDDIRCFMPPIKRGWRWSNGELLYCRKWEMEDAQLTTSEVTRRIIDQGSDHCSVYRMQ